MSRDIYRDLAKIKHSESLYNNALIHSMFRAMVSSMPALLEFYPGEEQLTSMTM